MNLSGVNLQQNALLHYGKLLGMPQPDIAYIMSDSFHVMQKWLYCKNDIGLPPFQQYFSGASIS